MRSTTDHRTGMFNDDHPVAVATIRRGFLKAIESRLFNDPAPCRRSDQRIHDGAGTPVPRPGDADRRSDDGREFLQPRSAPAARKGDRQQTTTDCCGPSDGQSSRPETHWPGGRRRSTAAASSPWPATHDTQLASQGRSFAQAAVNRGSYIIRAWFSTNNVSRQEPSLLRRIWTI